MRSPRNLLRALSGAAFAGAALCGGTTARAQGYYGQNQVQYQKFDWRIMRTEHFDVHYYPREAIAAKLAARMAERSYARLSRLLNYTFKERKPIVIFASRGDFGQSNIFGDLGESTLGATDPIHQRNTFFLEMDLAGTEHVLTHEMVHVFQFDEFARGHAGNGLQTLIQNGPPGWYMEGMAEYLSTGPDDPATDLIVRDAALNGNLPSIKPAENGPTQYLDYRYGESFWRFIGQRWGDEIIGEILASTPTLGADRAFKRHTGFDLVELSDEWKETMQTTYLPGIANLDRPRKTALPLLNPQRTGGVFPVYVAPAFSPDGRQIAFISGGSLLRAEVFLDLYLADATTGKRLKRLTTSTINPEFEELRIAFSQSAFSPDGRSIAFTAQTGGKDVLYVEDVKNLQSARRLDSGLEAMVGPSWSPDGKRLVFSGAQGGFTNVYMIDADGRNLRQLTTGDFSAMMPSWSPDGRRVAFVSDRGPATDLSTLKFGKWAINVLDLETGNIDVIPGQRGKNLNPNWSPDGKSLAYISDRTGIPQLFIYDFDKKEHYQITKFINGVQALSADSPAITWARQADKIAFTYMDDGKFTIWSMANPRQLMKDPYRDPVPVTVVATMSAADSAQQRASMAASALQAIAKQAAAQQLATAPTTPTVPPAPPAPEQDSTNGRRQSVYRGPGGLRPSSELPAAGQPGSEPEVSVRAMLDSATLALPDPNTFTDEPYKAKLSAEAVQRPQIGYAQNSYNNGVYGGTAILWGDLLGNRQLITAAAINGTLEDAQVFVDYVSLSQRLSWSAGLQMQPYYFLAGANENNVGGNNFQISEEIDRYVVRSAFFSSIYPKNRFDRFEVGASFTNIDKSAEFISSVTDIVSGYGTGYYVDSIKGLGSYDYASPYVAYVSDNALWGVTGPIYGHRYRLQVGTNVGSLSWMSYMADLRRYDAIIFSYLTLATRLYANINVGNGETLFPQYIGQPGYIRGYDREAYLSSNCGVTGTSSTCSAAQLLGSRVALGSAELRFPVVHRWNLGFLPMSLPPVDGLFFYDAGMAWTGGQSVTLGKPANYDPSTMRYPLRSYGYGVRVNVFNIAILAFDYSIPLDSFNKQGYWWWSIGQSF